MTFVRRRDASLPGVTEFLIASAALRFQDEGAELLSLSGASLARFSQNDTPDALECVLDQIGRGLEPVYGFRSLLAFTAKFQPAYLPRYLTYPEATALPAIGTAIARAYLPDLDAAGGGDTPAPRPSPPPSGARMNLHAGMGRPRLTKRDYLSASRTVERAGRRRVHIGVGVASPSVSRFG